MHSVVAALVLASMAVACSPRISNEPQAPPSVLEAADKNKATIPSTKDAPRAPRLKDAMKMTSDEFGCPAGTEKKNVVTVKAVGVRCEDKKGDVFGPVMFFHKNGIAESVGKWGKDYKQVGRWYYYDEQGNLMKVEDH